MCAAEVVVLLAARVVGSMVCGLDNLLYAADFLLGAVADGGLEKLLADICYRSCRGVYKVVAIEAVVA